MKALIEWIKNFLGLVKVEEVKPEPVVEEKLTPPKPAPIKKTEPKKEVAAKGPKAKKGSGEGKCDFSKLTKAQLLAEAKHRDVAVKASAKKADILAELNKLK